MNAKLTRYYLTHTDAFGERHQIAGAYAAESPEAAIKRMLNDAQAEDDGRWEAHVVKDEGEIIP